MTAILHTSTQFACATAAGRDWREVGRKILEALEGIRTENDGMNVGFLYATESLAEDYASLLSLFKNITRIDTWVGATGAGICGNGASFTQQPAATVMIGRLGADSFHPFSLPADFDGDLPPPIRKWQRAHQAQTALTHGLLCAPAARALDILRENCGLYTVGGFSSARRGGIHAGPGGIIEAHPLSGLIFDDSLHVMVATSQGCLAAGPLRQITAVHDNVITEIDGQPALDMLHESIELIRFEEKNETMRKGHIHIAFPVSGMDTGALMVRNITNADETARSLSVAHNIALGDSMQFVYRDSRTALDDLTGTLKGLHMRARQNVGEANLKPKALLYFGCAARVPAAGVDNDTDEAALIKSIFGDIPTAGFYTAAEVCNGHVYGYTGVAVLIL